MAAVGIDRRGGPARPGALRVWVSGALTGGATLAIVAAGLVTPELAHAGTVYTVTTLADSGAGSLRSAIASAADGDSIVFAPSATGTINLASSLTLDHAITIDGPGADHLTINGQNQVQDLVVDASASVSGVTITGGAATFGGGVDNESNLVLSHVRVSGNTASGSGGGIVSDGVLTVVNSTVSGNSAPSGGGILANLPSGAGLQIERSTISGNTATSGEGAAVYANGEPVFSGGQCGPPPPPPPPSVRSDQKCGPDAQPAIPEPGGSGTTPPGRVTITTSTIADNSSPAGQAALYLNELDATTSVTSSTVAKNIGLGLADVSPVGYPVVAASIVAANTTDCSGVIADGGYNVDGDGTCGLSAAGSQSHAAGIAAALGALANNGGPTQTIALKQSSDPAHGVVPAAFTPAASSTSVCSAGDQRGVLPMATPCDVGAFQIERAPTISATVIFRRHHHVGIVAFQCASAAPQISITCPAPVRVRGAGSHTVGGTVVAQDGRAASVYKTFSLV